MGRKEISLESLYSSFKKTMQKMKRLLPDMAIEGDITVDKVTYRVNVTSDSWDAVSVNLAHDFGQMVSNNDKTITFEVRNASSTTGINQLSQKFLAWVNAVLEKNGVEKQYTLKDFLL